ncbi:MAG: hypothetical protein IT319_02320 [Anaerolineae bacterium]|nr:hypothetical protein [Anaerolineae bacterium]
MSQTLETRRGNSATFWAFILIAVGVVWLLVQVNVFSSANLVVLLRLWPILLIAIGLNLLFGRGSQVLSLLIGAGTVLLLLALMVIGPSLGWGGLVDLRTAQYSEPIDEATSAQLDLDLSVGSVTIKALTGSNELIDADLSYIGDVNFDVARAGSEKLITLTSENDSTQWYNFLGFSFSGADDHRLRWDIGLTPDIPLDLRLQGGVGDNLFDLSGIQLSNFSLNGGVGESTITLPDGSSYKVSLNTGIGEMRVNFAENAAVDATIQSGIGGITLDVPDGAAVRLENQGGLGGVNVPGNFTRISGEDNNGVWETAGYRNAPSDARITIEVEGGIGGLTVR